MRFTYSDVAGMIDHSLLNPTLTVPDLEEGIRVAGQYEVASVSRARWRYAKRPGAGWGSRPSAPRPRRARRLPATNPSTCGSHVGQAFRPACARRFAGLKPCPT